MVRSGTSAVTSNRMTCLYLQSVSLNAPSGRTTSAHGDDVTESARLGLNTAGGHSMIYISIKTTEILVSADQEGRMKVPI